jgi:hypothetical protein
MNAEKLVSMNVGPNLTQVVEALRRLPYEDAREVGLDMEWFSSNPEKVDYEGAGRAEVEGMDVERLYNFCEHVGEAGTSAKLAGYSGDEEDSEGFYDWIMGCGTRSNEAEVLRQYIVERVTDWKEFCYEVSARRLEDYTSPILEYWQVSEFLAKLLGKRGERVANILGVTIWGRTTCGQAIKMDRVVEEIVEEIEGEINA